MELPLCAFDLKSGILCPRCEEKVSRGLYDELDIKMMKILLELEKEFPKLSKTGYVKTIDTKDTIFIVLKEDSFKHLTQDIFFPLLKKLKEQFKEKIKIVEDDKEISRFIEKLVAPARIITINKIWLPDGSEEMRIILDNERSLKISPEAVSEVVRKVKNTIVRIDFEEKTVRGRLKIREEKKATP
ncbi:MAG: hypothetical protein QXE67_04540 [Nitrososphaerota archaeon]